MSAIHEKHFISVKLRKMSGDSFREWIHLKSITNDQIPFFLMKV
jgi:hypothetical protein